MTESRDPRSEAEKARAALKRNAEMDSSTVPMSPLTRQPSVTPDTFGEHGAKARALSGSDQGWRREARLRRAGAVPAVRSRSPNPSRWPSDATAPARPRTRRTRTRCPHANKRTH